MPNEYTTITGPTHQAGGRLNLQPDLASVGEGIVSRLSAVLDHKVSLTNLSGNIIADQDLSNFDKFVPSSLMAIQKGTDTELPANEIDETSGWIIPLRHQDKTLGTLIIRNQPQPSDDVVPLAKSLAELLLYQMLVMDKVAQENRIVDKFFYDLFETDQPKDKLLRDTQFFNSQYLQLDFERPRVAALLTLKNFWRDVYKNQPILPGEEHKLSVTKDKIVEAAKEHLKTEEIIVAYMGQDDFALLLQCKETDSKNSKTTEYICAYDEESLKNFLGALDEIFHTETFLGLGSYHEDITGLVKSFQGAKKAVKLGIKLAPQEKIYRHQDYLLPIMLENSDQELKKLFVAKELGELVKEGDLVETLARHFDSNLNLKKTAYELGIHKNTLYYRLAKIKKVLGADPQEFNKALKLKIALYLWEMMKEEE